MRVEMVSLDGIMLKALVIEDGDESVPCENCGQPKWDHPDLARDVDEDWCLNCNDEAMNLSEFEYQMWCLKQAAKGKIVFVGRFGDE
tara:strand:+ start:3727 stop:3987 length:261 start_codon:yes stop_codon:yes gene_type:complete